MSITSIDTPDTAFNLLIISAIKVYLNTICLEDSRYSQWVGIRVHLYSFPILLHIIHKLDKLEKERKQAPYA